MIYLDSSALVKRYLEEVGSNTVRSVITSAAAIATSKLSFPEMLSAFMRKRRAGEIGSKALYGVVHKFETDWYHFFIIEFHDELLPKVKTLVEKHPLKAADAVHLSSALWLKQTTKADLTFVTSDSNLLKAALAEKLQVMNPLDETK
jgi:predicted nucleic acid-binding protein